MPSPLLKSVFEFCIAVYRTFFRATFGNACCYQPSCSEYCVQAVESHGLFKGVGLGLLRILRCHPFAKGGVDEVPVKVHSGKKPFSVEMKKAGQL